MEVQHCANIVELDGLGDGSFDYAACLFSTLGMVSGSADSRRRWSATSIACFGRAGGSSCTSIIAGSTSGTGEGGDGWRGTFCGHWRASRVRVTGRCRDRGIAGLSLHQFKRGEAVRLLRGVGFHLREVRPVGLGKEATLPRPWWLGRLGPTAT